MSSSAVPRVCLCVMMNHPFPANLPILRDIYAGRFTHVVFLIPFERMADEDVITVYRGSYAHAAFLTDAAERLKALDCDYYVIVHDDVMLNPRLSEATFRETFPLGARDGYISWAKAPSGHIGTRAWYYASLPRLLYPKSMLLGTGVDPGSVAKYLPSTADMAQKLDAAGVAYRTDVKLDDAEFEDVANNASRLLLHGHTRPPDNTAIQATIEEMSVKLERLLVEIMAADQGQQRPDLQAGSGRLPFPILDAACYADFYILPKRCFEDFAHYAGVAAASGVFVEIAVPILLYAVCDRVWQAAELDLEVAFFSERNSLKNFTDPKFVAIHPFKLSAYTAPAARTALLSMLGDLARGRPPTPPKAAPGGYPFEDVSMADDWHATEAWGRWAAKASAAVDFVYTPGAVERLRLRLTAPLSDGFPDAEGEVRLNGARIAEVRLSPARPAAEIDIEARLFTPDAVNRIEIVSARLVIPDELNGQGDLRTLGFGLLECAFS